MAVPFNAIPGNQLVPFFYAEVNSGGTPFSSSSRLLLIGQKTAAGVAAAGQPYDPIRSEAEAIAQLGLGSMLVAMVDIARLAAPFQEIWALPIADPAGAAATGTITISVKIGNLSAQATFGNGRNDRHVTVVGTQSFRTPPWERAACWAAVAAAHLSDAPELSRPLQTLALPGVLPPFNKSLNWTISDRQTLYVDGIAAEVVNVDGTVAIDRAVTTYKTNAASAPDATFRDVETMAQCMFVARSSHSQLAMQLGLHRGGCCSWPDP